MLSKSSLVIRLLYQNKQLSTYLMLLKDIKTKTKLIMSQYLRENFLKLPKGAFNAKIHLLLQLHNER